MSTTMTVRLEQNVKKEWQIGEIQAALKEADAGDFASDKDVTALAKKWKVNAGQVAAQGTAKP